MLDSNQVGNIEELGAGIFTCHLNCAGITCDAPGGRPPRGLVLELRERSQGPGVIVVGLNPGRARSSEVSLLKGLAAPYQAWKAYWEANLMASNPYFTGTRALINQCGISGPILWTNLAKCQSAGPSAPPLQTLRTCMERYLEYEVWSMPRTWPFLALGRDAYTALGFRFPDRCIIGVPHPSGAKPNFRRLFEGTTLHAQVRTAIEAALVAEPPVATWVAGVNT